MQKTWAREEACTDRVVPLPVIQSVHDAVVHIENAQMLRDVWIANHSGAVEPLHRHKALDGPPYADMTGPSATDAHLQFFARQGL